MVIQCHLVEWPFMMRAPRLPWKVTWRTLRHCRQAVKPGLPAQYTPQDSQLKDVWASLSITLYSRWDRSSAQGTQPLLTPHGKQKRQANLQKLLWCRPVLRNFLEARIYEVSKIIRPVSRRGERKPPMLMTQLNSLRSQKSSHLDACSS